MGLEFGRGLLGKDASASVEIVLRRGPMKAGLQRIESHPCRRCKGGGAPRKAGVLQVGPHWRFRPQFASG
jgi:hypothetical protein